MGKRSNVSHFVTERDQIKHELEDLTDLVAKKENEMALLKA